jgi:hypothetical protein
MAGHHKWSNVKRRNDALGTNLSRLCSKLAPESTPAAMTARVLPEARPQHGALMSERRTYRPRRASAAVPFERTRAGAVLNYGRRVRQESISAHVQVEVGADSVRKAGLRSDWIPLISAIKDSVSSKQEIAAMRVLRVCPALLGE